MSLAHILEKFDAIGVYSPKMVITIDQSFTGSAELAAMLLSSLGQDAVSITCMSWDRSVANDSLVLTGTATLLNMDNAVVAFSASERDGNLLVTIAVTIPSGWSFLQSFPDLPGYYDPLASEADRCKPSFLNELSLGASTLIFTNQAHSSAEFKADLLPGLNFAGELFFMGALFGLKTLTGTEGPVLVSGPVREYRSVPEPLEFLGLRLRSPLQLAGGDWPIPVRSPSIFLKSPVDDTQSDHTVGITKGPGIYFFAEIDIAGRPAELIAKYASSEGPLVLTLYGRMTDFALAGFSSLTQTVGGDDIQTSLPAEIQTPEGLALTEFGMSADFTNLSILSLMVGVGCKTEWEIIPDKLVIEEIGISIRVFRPFDSKARALALTLSGTVAIGDVNLVAFAEYPTYRFGGGLPEDETIALGEVIKTYFPGAPALPDMTISTLLFNADPTAKTFSMVCAMNDLLSIPVGATSFDIQGFSFAVNYNGAAGVTGAFTADTTIAEATAVISGELTDTLTLSGSLQKFDLKKFWSLVTGGEELPDAVPDIIFDVLTITVSPDTGAFSALGSVTIPWDYLSADNPLTTNIQFSFAKSVVVSGGSKTSSLSARLSLEGTGPLDVVSGLSLKRFNLLFEYQTGVAWKLSGGIDADIFDTALYLQAGYESSQLGEKIKLQVIATPEKKLIHLAGIGSYAFQQLDLAVDRRDAGGGKKKTFFDLRVGSTLKIDGVFSIGGYLSIQEKPEGGAGLLFKPYPDTAAFKLSFPTGEGIGLKAELFEIGFVKESESVGWAFTGTIYISFTGLPSGWAAALPSRMFAKLTAGNGIASISTLNVTDPISVALPAAGGKDAGKLVVQVLEVGIPLRPALGLTADVGIGFPAELNSLLGSQLFRVYQEGNILSMSRTRFTITAGGVAMQFVTPPFAGVNTAVVAGESWFDIDFGKYGAISIKMPTFVYDGVTQYFEAGGGVKVTKSLAVPLVPLKAFLNACGSKDFADMFPDKVPIESLSLVDNNNDLKVDELIAFMKKAGDVPQEVTQALKQAGKVLNRFPDGFKQYFRLEVPESLEFKFGYSPAGRVSLALIAPETPVRVLFPSVVQSYVPLPGLTGMEIHKINVGTVSAGSLFFGEVDAVIDQFDMPSLALSLMLPADEDFPLPTSDQLQRRLVLKNVFCMIPVSAGLPIPIPIFYDEIGFDYMGIEGLGLGAHISFPQPTSSGLVAFFTTLQEFVSDSKTRLDPNSPPEGMELTYRFWDEYLQAPEYLGGGAAGMKGKQVKVSLWRYIATMMNFFKSFSVNDFVGAIPYQYRVGSRSCKFGFLSFDADWLLTTPLEFKNGAFKQLKLSARDRDDFIDVLPSVATAQGQTVKGNEQGLVMFMRGQAELAFVRLEVVFGLAASGSLGFNTGFKIDGRVGSVIDMELGGAVMVNAPLAEEGPAAPAPGPVAAVKPGEKLQHDGLVFSGQGDFALIPKSDKFALDRYTVEAWVRPDKEVPGSWQEIWGGHGKSAKLYIHSSGIVSHRFFSNKKFNVQNTGEGLIRWGQWNHLAITNDGKTYRTFINGVEKDSGPVAGTLVCEPVAVRIGRHHDGKDQSYFRGSIDDLRYFSVARTQAQIQSDMDVALSGKEAGIVAYYNMDHTCGAELVDLGPNKLNGKVTGATWALAAAPADTQRAAVQIQGHVHLTVAKHKALVGDLRLVDSEFWFTGKLDLFPKDWPIRVYGYVEGMLSRGRFYLTGETENKLFGLVLSRSRLYISNEQIRLEGRWLGMYTLLDISWEKNNPFFRGALYTSASPTIDFGTIRIKGVKVADNVRIAVDIDIDMGVVISKKGFSANIDARFAINGKGFSLSLTVKAAPSELKEVVDAVVKKIIKEPLKYAGHLFADAATWLKNVGEGAIAFAKDSGEAVGAALKTAFGVSKDALGPMLNGAGYAATEVGAALTSAYNATAEEAAKLLKGARYAVEDVGKFLHGHGIDSQTASRYLKNIGYDAKAAGAALQTAYRKSYRDAAKLLKNAGFNSNAVSDALRKTYKVGYKDATKALKSAGFSAKDIGGSLKSVYGTSSDDVGRALKEAGFSADDIAGVMRGVFGMSAKSTAKYLKGTLDYGKGTVKGALKSAGFSNKDINKAIDWLGGLFK